MLDFVGIKSNFILVRAGDDVPDVKKEYTMNQFNHVFLAVPFKRDMLLYECTSQTSPPNFTGVFTGDRIACGYRKMQARFGGREF